MNKRLLRLIFQELGDAGMFVIIVFRFMALLGIIFQIWWWAALWHFSGNIIVAYFIWDDRKELLASSKKLYEVYGDE